MAVARFMRTPTVLKGCTTAHLREKGPNSHGARPVHLIITMIKWIRTRA